MSNKINDFGNKIFGAKKDFYGSSMSFDEYSKMPESSKQEFCTKKNIWPKMNYNKLIEEGYNNIQVGWVKYIYDAIDNQPLYSYENDNYFKFVSKMRELVLDGLSMPYEDWEKYINYKTREPETFSQKYKNYKWDPNNKVHLKSDRNNKITNSVNSNADYIIRGYLLKKDLFLTNTQKAKITTHLFQYDEENLDITNEMGRTALVLKQGYNKSYIYSELYNSADKGDYIIYNSRIDNLLSNAIKYKINDFKFKSEKEQEDFIKLLVAKDANTALENYIKVVDFYSKYLDSLDTEISAKKETKKEVLDQKKKKITFDSKITINYDNRRNCKYSINKNITGQDYLNTFGFYGGEFGNWLNQTDRQEVLNCGYDSFLDLAYALNIKPESISLNNELSIAFGSRGKGGKSPAVAHYEPLFNVINLTKMHGAGALAHEWGHALDYYLSANGMKNEMKEITNSLRRKEITVEEGPWTPEQLKEECKVSAMKALNNRFHKLEHSTRYVGCKEYAQFTPEQKDDYKNFIVNTVVDYVIDTGGHFNLDKYREYHNKLETYEKSITGLDKAKIITNFTPDSVETAVSMTRINQPTETKIVNKIVDTDYLLDSKKFDAQYTKSGLGYWADDKELFARAFDQYICDKLGFDNQFLTTREFFGQQPIPKGEEKEQFTKKMDKLIETAKQKGLLKEMVYETEDHLKEFYSPFIEEENVIEDHLIDMEQYQYEQTGLEL